MTYYDSINLVNRVTRNITRNKGNITRVTRNIKKQGNKYGKTYSKKVPTKEL